MASIDFAVLAEFARTDENGLFTIVQGGFTDIAKPSFPGNQQVALALRINVDDGEESINIGVIYRAPENAYQIRAAGVTHSLADLPPERNAFAVVAGIILPLPTPGIYSVDVELNGKIARTLTFNVRQIAAN